MSNYLQEIKQKIKIIDVLQHYLTFTKKGKNIWAICPFHQDTKPSLSISEEKNIFKCFSCGIGGDAIMFVMKHEQLNLHDSIKKIANLLNITLDNHFLKVDKNFLIKNKLHKLNRLIATCYHKNLFSDLNNEQLNYLIKTRNLSKEIITEYLIGYCPRQNILKEVISNWNNLNPDENYFEEDLEKLGIIIKTQNKELISFFGERIIFPIINNNKEVVGFSGRTIKTNESIKYLNSSETLIFKKSSVLYNEQNLLKKQNIYIFEGPMDVLSARRCEVISSVALMGLNLSFDHIQKLKSFSHNIILCLDNDQAGRDNNINIFKKLLIEGFIITVIDLLDSSEKDIDEIINKNIENAKQKLHKPITFFEWYKKYWLLNNNNKFSFSELQKVINEMLSWFFYEKFNQIYLNDNINSEFASSSVDEIFEFYKLSSETIDINIISEQKNKYKNLIINSVIHDNNILKTKTKNIPTQTTILHEKDDIIFYQKSLNVISGWVNNFSEIISIFDDFAWYLPLDYCEYIKDDWQTTLSFMNKNIAKKSNISNINENKKKIQELQQYLNNKNKKINVFEFFEFYYAFHNFLLNQQNQSIQKNLIFTFEEKYRKKSLITEKINHIEQLSSNIFKKLLLFYKN